MSDYKSAETTYSPALYRKRPTRLLALKHGSWTTAVYAAIGTAAFAVPTALIDGTLWLVSSVHPMPVWAFLVPVLTYPFIVNETAFYCRKKEDEEALQSLYSEAMAYDAAIRNRADLSKPEPKRDELSEVLDRITWSGMRSDIKDYGGESNPHPVPAKPQPVAAKPTFDTSWALLAVLEDVRPQFDQLRRDTAFAIVQLGRAYMRTIAKLGTAESKRPREIAQTALDAIVLPRIAEHKAIVEAMHESDIAKSSDIVADFELQAAALATGRTAQRTPAKIDTGSARVNRMVDTARRALEIDKDMVDDTGAPVKALIERHLPDLLAKHSAASRHARLEDLPTLDRQLDEGIELIRKSVEEGIARLRSDKAADLQEEIAFLKLRRGGDEPFGLPAPRS